MSIRWVALVMVVAAVIGVAWAQEKEVEKGKEPETKAEAPELQFSGSLVTTGFAVQNAFFGATDRQPVDGEDANYLWLESVGKARLEWQVTPNITAHIGAAGMLTQGRDYYGTRDGQDMVLDLAALTFKGIGGSGFDLTLGRQDFQIGDGFVAGDGYYETKAANWSIPLNFYDAVKLDYTAGSFRGTAFLANLSNSFGGQEGGQGGLDLGWSFTEKNSVAVSYFTRSDSGPTDNDANALAGRGSVAWGPIALAGEYVKESGRIEGRELDAKAFHADLTWNIPGDREAYVRASYLFFSGDDPETADNEQYYSWNYRWNDWCQYYVGDIVGSQMLFNTDEKILKLEAGLKLTPNNKLRLFFMNTKLDTGSSMDRRKIGFGKNFANELDLVWDYAPKPEFSLWVLFAAAQPKEAAKLFYGDQTALEILTGITVNF